MSATIVERRSRPNVVLLDAEFRVCGPPAADAPPRAEEFGSAARRIVGERLDHLDVGAGRTAFRVRVARMRGPDPVRYAMVVERRGSRRPLLDAYDRFGLSAREIEVLALIVGGASNREIAETLCIVAGTVQDHVRAICAKTRAKRRGDLLARVFGVHET